MDSSKARIREHMICEWQGLLCLLGLAARTVGPVARRHSCANAPAHNAVESKGIRWGVYLPSQWVHLGQGHTLQGKVVRKKNPEALQIPSRGLSREKFGCCNRAAEL